MNVLPHIVEIKTCLYFGGINSSISILSNVHYGNNGTFKYVPLWLHQKGSSLAFHFLPFAVEMRYNKATKSLMCMILD